MTTDYNPTEAQRLISEAREDDARLIDAPWTAHRHHSRGPDDWVLTKSDETYELLQKDEALAIARTRNNLRDLADQLEAAGKLVADAKSARAILEKHWSLTSGAPLTEHALRIMERLRHDHEGKCGVVVEKMRQSLAERDSLRAALTKVKDEHIGDCLAWLEKEHALTMECASLRQQLDMIGGL